MALTESQVKLNTGDEAPDFQLKGIDEKTYSLGDFEGVEGFLIIFMCNHCPYVKAKIDDLNALQEKFNTKIAIIGINSNDPEYPGEGMEHMKEFAKERNIQFTYVLDATQEVAKSYGATCTPDPFLFDKDKKLVFHGRINDAMEPDDTASENTMQLNIEKMLQGASINPSFNPSRGCSIKWT